MLPDALLLIARLGIAARLLSIKPDQGGRVAHDYVRHL